MPARRGPWENAGFSDDLWGARAAPMAGRGALCAVAGWSGMVGVAAALGRRTEVP
jgi:hypothetical protein